MGADRNRLSRPTGRYDQYDLVGWLIDWSPEGQNQCFRWKDHEHVRPGPRDSAGGTCAGRMHLRVFDKSPISDPPGEAATRVTPGTTTRDTVRQMLGSPLWSSARWRAELYCDEAVLQAWNYGLLVPIPTSTERIQPDPCPGSRQARVEGDLQGLEIEDYHILLAPGAASRDVVAEAPSSGRCTLEPGWFSFDHTRVAPAQD